MSRCLPSARQLARRWPKSQLLVQHLVNRLEQGFGIVVLLPPAARSSRDSAVQQEPGDDILLLLAVAPAGDGQPQRNPDVLGIGEAGGGDLERGGDLSPGGVFTGEPG
jgi:hypothetical protein